MRFSIKTLLWVTVVVAVGCICYKHGERRGYARCQADYEATWNIFSAVMPAVVGGPSRVATFGGKNMAIIFPEGPQDAQSAGAADGADPDADTVETGGTATVC